MRDRLSLLIDQAALKARSSSIDQARAGAKAFDLAGKARLLAAADPRIAAIVDDVLQAAWLLAGHDGSRARDPDTGLIFSNENLLRALACAKSMKDAARQLGCDRKTISRRVKNFNETLLTMSHLPGAPSLRRSKAIRKSKRMSITT